ncbi:MAG: hypothetical protein AAB440_00705 [Patescibacteria group bacterium]
MISLVRRLDSIHRSRLFLIVLLVVVCGVVSLLIRFGEPLFYPEVTELSSSSWSADAYAGYLTDLAKRKGAVYAFAVLYKASFPFGIDTHVLGHRIGYVLYDERGSEAIRYCTETYRDDACVHAVVIQEYVTQGRAALTTLAAACESIPRGTSGYADCFHGIGHGILAYLEYDYETTIVECKAVGEAATGADPMTDHQAQFVWKQCVDGATMELMQGLHDQEAWSKAIPTYMPEDDLRMPCNASYVPAEVRGSCYIYVRPRMLRAAGIAADEYTFDQKKYTKALAYCEMIPEELDRKTCYGGFGMQFVYSVNGNDNRTFGELSLPALTTVHELCALASFEGRSACIATAAETILGRSRDVETVSTFCGLTEDAVLQDRCYTAAIGLIKQYVPNATVYPFCAIVPHTYWLLCQEALNSP